MSTTYWGCHTQLEAEALKRWVGEERREGLKGGEEKGEGEGDLVFQ